MISSTLILQTRKALVLAEFFSVGQYTDFTFVLSFSILGN